MFTMSTAANPLRNDRTRRTNHRYETRISTTKARVRGRMKRARRKCSLSSLFARHTSASSGICDPAALPR
jgi:hypothetical protein